MTQTIPTPLRGSEDELIKALYDPGHITNTPVRRFTKILKRLFSCLDPKLAKRMACVAVAMIIEDKRSFSKWKEYGYFDVAVSTMLRSLRKLRDTYDTIMQTARKRILKHVKDCRKSVRIIVDYFVIARQGDGWAVLKNWSGLEDGVTRGITIVDVWIEIGGQKFPFGFDVWTDDEKITEIGGDLVARAVKWLLKAGYQSVLMYVSGDSSFTNSTVVDALREGVETVVEEEEDVDIVKAFPPFIGHLKKKNKQYLPGDDRSVRVDTLFEERRKRIREERGDTSGRGRPRSAVHTLQWEQGEGEKEEEVEYMEAGPLRSAGLGKCKVFAFRFPGNEEWKYYTSTKEDISARRMLREVKSRWPAEQGHKEGRQHRGGDRFFVRKKASVQSYLCLSYVLGCAFSLYKVAYGGEQSTEELSDEFYECFRPLLGGKVQTFKEAVATPQTGETGAHAFEREASGQEGEKNKGDAFTGFRNRVSDLGEKTWWPIALMLYGMLFPIDVNGFCPWMSGLSGSMERKEWMRTYPLHVPPPQYFWKGVLPPPPRLYDGQYWKGWKGERGRGTVTVGDHLAEAI